jgi:hypothetical protein
MERSPDRESILTTSNNKWALERCLKAYAAENAEHKARVQELLADRTRTRREVAKFCAYSLQYDALDLEPWQAPPCILSSTRARDLEPHDRQAHHIMRSMVKAGISIYEPDPLAALAAVRRRAND